MSKNLAKFVKEGEVSTIQTALIVELEDKNLTAQQLHDQANAVAKLVPNLWDPYEEKSFARNMEKDQSNWTNEYYGKQIVYLEANFSKERYEHVIKVRDYLSK